MPTTTTATSRRGRFWPYALAGFLAVVVLANGAFVWVATRDPSFAVEPDAYEKGLAWDRTMAQERHNAALGWTIRLDVAPAASAGKAVVTARLADRAGRPLRGVGVAADAFHNARAADVFHASFAPGDDGAYRAEMPIRRPGLWEFRFTVRRGNDLFTETLRTDVADRASLPGVAERK